MLLGFVYRRLKLETTPRCVGKRMNKCINIHNMEEVKKKQNKNKKLGLSLEVSNLSIPPLQFIYSLHFDRL